MKLSTKRPKPGASAALRVKRAEKGSVRLEGGLQMTDPAAQLVWSVRGENVVCTAQRVKRRRYARSVVGFSYTDVKTGRVERGTAVAS